ncbi:MAG: NAD-dependent dehydratase [Verrucomicrobia bacterium 21-51-4]|nr:MAG: NAD-dependent dehydratase [Verrucomicrobia bacterium 21-51-4]HQU08506.1 NAD-dependent epimerase/dehydratase family protein [Opitutales bacterium]
MPLTKKILICGAGGFIGGHMVRYLLEQGYKNIRAVDIKPLNTWYLQDPGVENLCMDLKEKSCAYKATEGCQEVYNYAADMGGMGFIEHNKALCMLSVLINTHLLMAAKDCGVERFFYASSACVYAADKQTDPHNPGLKETDAYPAMPEDGYGWEKLFSERMCRHFREDYGLITRTARFHNIYGPYGTYEGGREKAPAALSRKIATVALTGNPVIEIWGDGQQTRSFTYIDDCLVGSYKIMHSNITEPLNLGSSEMIKIDDLAYLIANIAGVKIELRHNLDAPKGVRGRNSDNTLIIKKLDWEPKTSLRDGLTKTYAWVYEQVAKNIKSAPVSV